MSIFDRRDDAAPQPDYRAEIAEAAATPGIEPTQHDSETPQYDPPGERSEPAPAARPTAQQQPAAPEGDPEDTPAPGGMVPVATVRAERQKRQDAERRAAEITGEMTAIKAMLEQLRQQQMPQQPQPQAPVEIDVEADPIGAVKALKQQLAETTRQTQFAQMDAQITRAYENTAVEFARANPDYPAAYLHLTASRSQELAALGHPPQAVQAILANEEKAIAAQSFQNGQNPHERILQLAKLRGFTPKPAAAAGAPVDPVAAVAAQAKRAAAATTIAPGGKAPTSAMTTAELANLDGEAFDKGFEALFGRQRSQASRGGLFRR